MIRLHSLAPDLLDIHPIWIWYNLYYWQRLKYKYDASQQREIAFCDHMLDFYSDLIMERAAYPVPYTFGYTENIYNS